MKIIFYIINCFDCTNLFTNLKMQVTIHSVFQIYKIGVLKKMFALCSTKTVWQTLYSWNSDYEAYFKNICINLYLIKMKILEKILTDVK